MAEISKAPNSLVGELTIVRKKGVARRFVQDVGALTASAFLGAVLSVVQGILVARLLGPQRYGIAGLIMNFPSLVFSFVDARSVDASVKYLAEFSVRGEAERAVAVCKLCYLLDMGIALLSFAIVAMSAGWAGERIVHSQDETYLMVVFAAAFLPRSLVGTSRAVLATLGRFSALAWVEGLTAILRTVAVLGLILTGSGVAGVVWGNGAALAFQGVLLGVIAYPSIKRAWGGSWVTASLRTLTGRYRDLLGFLFYNDLNVLLGVFLKQFDLTLVGYFRGPGEAGFYKLAKSLGGVFGYVQGPLQSVVYPRIARARLGFEDLKGLVSHLTFKVGFPLAILALATIPFVPWITLFVGKAYGPTVVAARIFVASSAVGLTFFWLRPLYLSSGGEKVWAAATGLSSVAFIAVGLVSLVLWGYLGITWTFLLVNYAAAAILFQKARRTYLWQRATKR